METEERQMNRPREQNPEPRNRPRQTCPRDLLQDAKAIRRGRSLSNKCCRSIWASTVYFHPHGSLWGSRLPCSSHFRDEGLGLRTVTRKTIPVPPPPPPRSPRAWTGRTSVFSSAETLTFIVTKNSQFSFPGQGRTS